MGEFDSHKPAPPHSSHPGCLWVGLCLGLALFGVFLSPMALSVRHPPKLYPEWLMVGSLGLGTIAVALWLSAHRWMRWPVRMGLGAAILLALVPLSMPVLSYYESFHDMPWVVVIFVVGVFLVGGWLGRQKWLTVLTLGAILLFAYQVHLPPSGEGLPATRTDRDLAVTIQALKRSGKVVFVDFTIEAKPGVPVATEYDLERIGVEGKILRVLPVTGWSAHQWPLEHSPPNEACLSSYTFPPTWSRRLDYVITVPRWPDEPAASITVAVPPKGQGRLAERVEAAEEGMTLVLEDLHWATVQESGMDVPALAIGLTYDRYGPENYWTGSVRLRVTDDKHNVLPACFNVYRTRDDYSESESGYCPAAEDTKTITIDAYSPHQWQENLHVFRFKRLPNPRPNAS